MIQVHTSAENALGRTPLFATNAVSIDDTGRWLVEGWRDFLRTPVFSLIYGGLFALLAYGMLFGLQQAGIGSLFLPLAAAFMLVAPILAVPLYGVSRALHAGQPVRIGAIAARLRDTASGLAVVGLALLLLVLAWFVVAMALFGGFYGITPPTLEGFVAEVLLAPQAPAFLLIGTLVGAVPAVIAFAISAVSLPLIYDHNVSPYAAMLTSVTAVRNNWRVMIGWAAGLVFLVGLGMALFLVGLAWMLPFTAYATWHGYRAMVTDSHAAAQIP